MEISTSVLQARPFIKWAGGKTQLIPAIKAALPAPVFLQDEVTYIEPFVGSGALLFWILQQFPNVTKAVINDINTDLVSAYKVIKEQPSALVKALQNIQATYYLLQNEEDRKSFFLQKRLLFNKRSESNVDATALLIFLNRTCFNGLFRVNSNNQFNVPFGSYKNPTICDEKNIYACSRLLQKVTILNGDYQQTLSYATGNTFFYFDPPYKPISITSSFNSYAKDVFDDDEQTRLKQFCDKLTSEDHKWLLSNSDPKNNDPNDNFFDDLFSGENYHIERVKARRNINSKGAGRGEIFEILVSNYPQQNHF